MQPQYITLSKHAKNLTNQRFGRLTALGPIGRDTKNKILYQCQCDCGKVMTTLAESLRSGNTQSCGCLKGETTAKRNTKHGMSHTKLFFRWNGMIQRCTNPNSSKYSDYGGRGITVCAEWSHDFQAFYNHVSLLPGFDNPGYSLDRIDNSGNYEPGNVRWQTPKQQTQNTRRNVTLTLNNKTQSVALWAEELKIKSSTIYSRLNRGMTLEQALSTVPVDR